MLNAEIISALSDHSGSNQALIVYIILLWKRWMVRKVPTWLRRSASVSRLQKIPNTTTRSKIQSEQSILNRIQRRQLKWYGPLLRMEDSRWPKKIYQYRTVGGEEEDRNDHRGTK